MAIYDFFLSRNNGISLENYTGHSGRLFYDSDEKVLRVADGVTPGGFPITPTTLVSTTEPTVAAGGQLWYNPNTFELWAYHNGDFRPTIDLATQSKIGGIKLGPGVTLNGQGQLIIDIEGLDFSFGDFAAITETYPVGHPKEGEDYAILQTVNNDEDAVLASNGEGGIKIVGNFQVYAPDGDVGGAMMVPPVFTIGNDGQTRIIVPSTDPTSGAVEIIGSTSGQSQSTVNTGVMLHITGNNSDASRIYNDSIGSFAAYVARRYNGTAVSPTAVLANEEIMRISGTAHNGTNIPGTGNQRIVYKALGNQTLSNQGGSIELWTTPINTTTLTKIATVDSVGITLESGKTLTATTGSFTNFSGKFVRTVRNAGTIGAGGTLTINFTTDSVVYCVWGDGMTINYQNFLAGSVVKVIATKASGTGVDTLSLDGITAAQTSSGSTTINANPDTTVFVEFTCTGTTLGSVYAKF